MSEWISVKRARPEKGKIFCCGPSGGLFLGLYKGGYIVDELDEMSCLAFDQFNCQPRRFLYWMPLPDPPE